VASIPPFVPTTEDERDTYAKGEAMYLKRKKAEEQTRERLASPSPNEEALNPELYPKEPKAASPRVSHSQLIHLMLPSDCTEGGVVQGGVIMKLMDNAAGCVAWRHCLTNVVTVSVEAMEFKAPIRNGDLVFVDAHLNFVSQKSLEIEIVVEAESMTSGTRTVTNTGIFKFVSLDKDHRPVSVRPLLLETRDDVKRFLDGKRRYEEARKSRSK